MIVTRSPSIDSLAAQGGPGDAGSKAREVHVILVASKEDKAQQESLWLVVDVVDLSGAYTQIFKKKVISLLLINSWRNSPQVNEDCILGKGRNMVEDRRQ